MAVAVAVAVAGAVGWLAAGGTQLVSCASVEVLAVAADPVTPETPVRRLVLMDNELEVVEGEAVRQRAGVLAGFPVEEDSLTVRVPANTEVLRLCYRDTSPDRAEGGAVAVVEAYQSVRQDAVLDSVATSRAAAAAARDQAASDVRSGLSEDELEAAQAAVDALGRRLDDLAALDTRGSEVLTAPGEAVLDTDHRRLVLVSAIAVGSLVGCVVAVRAPERPRPRSQRLRPTVRSSSSGSNHSSTRPER